MKIYSKSYLPESVTYNGENYFLNPAITSGMIANTTPISRIKKTLKEEGRKMVIVKVLPHSLRRKTDLHGKQYQPTVHIFTTNAINP